jgi:hypothetical protein
MVQNSDRALKATNALANPKIAPGFRNLPSAIVVTKAAARVERPAIRLSAPNPGNMTMSHGTVKTKNQSRQRVTLRIGAFWRDNKRSERLKTSAHHEVAESRGVFRRRFGFVATSCELSTNHVSGPNRRNLATRRLQRANRSNHDIGT